MMRFNLAHGKEHCILSDLGGSTLYLPLLEFVAQEKLKWVHIRVRKRIGTWEEDRARKVWGWVPTERREG